MIEFREKGISIEPLTLKPYFEKDPRLADVGGWAYIMRLATNLSFGALDIGDFADSVKDYAKRRAVIEICDMMSEDAFAGGAEMDTDRMLDKAEAEFLALRDLTQRSKRWTSLKDSIAGTVDQITKASKGVEKIGIATGLTDLDEIIGAFKPGKVYVLAGRPAMGKSATAGFFQIEAARQGIGVGNFSIEMDKDEQNERYLSDYTARDHQPITYSDMQKGRLDPVAITQLEKPAEALVKLPIYLFDDPTMTVSSICVQTRRLQRDLENTHSPLGLVSIDYLQLLIPERTPGWSRADEVSIQTRMIKNMARELQVSVLLISQLNRGVESRDNKRPNMADLRDSGAIEQDADAVLFLYRHEYYLKKDEPKDRRGDAWYKWRAAMVECQNVLEFIIAKQRGGPTGIERVFMDPSTATLRDLDKVVR